MSGRRDDAGVSIQLCGQTAVYRDIAESDLATWRVLVFVSHDSSRRVTARWLYFKSFLTLVKLLIPPPILGIIAGALMWATAHAVPQFRIDVPLLERLGSLFIATGILIEITSIIAFLKARTTVTPLRPEKASTLVVSGLYRISRNPMYLGLLILLIGWAFHLANPVALVFTPVFVGYMTAFQIKPEEAALEKKFGITYHEYKSKVRRWL